MFSLYYIRSLSENVKLNSDLMTYRKLRISPGMLVDQFLQKKCYLIFYFDD